MTRKAGDYKLLELEEVDSTNNFLRQYATSAEESIVVALADYQTAGRGSAANTWESEPGKNLLFSLLVQPTMIPVDRMFILSEILALAVCESLDGYATGFHIKWPNDIYYGDKKVVGMLIENHLQGTTIARSVMGVGLNVNQQVFLSDAPNPSSLALILGHSVERKEVLKQVMERFSLYYARLSFPSEYIAIHQTYLKRLYRMEERHEYCDADGRFWATMVDVQPTGHLILRDDTGQLRSYAFKEVQYII